MTGSSSFKPGQQQTLKQEGDLNILNFNLYKMPHLNAALNFINKKKRRGIHNILHLSAEDNHILDISPWHNFVDFSVGPIFSYRDNILSLTMTFSHYITNINM